LPFLNAGTGDLPLPFLLPRFPENRHPYPPEFAFAGSFPSPPSPICTIDPVNYLIFPQVGLNPYFAIVSPKLDLIQAPGYTAKYWGADIKAPSKIWETTCKVVFLIPRDKYKKAV
jgi:hypothetical protein